MKKRRIILAVTILVLTAALGIGALLHFKPDAVFPIRAKLYHMSHSVSLERAETSDYRWLEGSEDAVWDQSLLLVNEAHPLSPTYEPVLTEYNDSSLLMDPAVPEAYAGLAAEVQDMYGEKLHILSSYRNREEQLRIMEEEGEKAAGADSSEHRTGLALDICVPGFGGRSFLKTSAGQYVNLHGWEYGFIIRYPEGKQEITGIPYEPWHLRYVGGPHAKVISLSELTLEEYLDSLEPDAVYVLDGALISLQHKDRLRYPEGPWDVRFSPAAGDLIMMTAIPGK